MKVVVDSNIIFSAILNTDGKIGQLLMNGHRYFDFYTISLLRKEIVKYQSKIIDLIDSKPEKVDEIFRTVTAHIQFVDDAIITNAELKNAIVLTKDIDEDDTMFVALNVHLQATLWTGDKQLLKGLNQKGYDRLCTTDDLYSIFLKKEYERRR